MTQATAPRRSLVTVTRGTSRYKVLVFVSCLGLTLLALLIATRVPDYTILLFAKAMIFATAIVGLNLIAGFSGQLSLGHSAFFGLGAYATAILVRDYQLPFAVTVPIGIVLAAVAGLLVGIPALRVRGLYLALVTLAVGFIFPVLVRHFSELTGGPNGKVVLVQMAAPAPLTSLFTPTAWEFLIICTLAAGAFLVVSNIVRSRVGLALIALRDNEINAAVSGIDISRFKILTFAMSAAIGALAGSMYTITTPIVSPESVGFIITVELVAGLVIGGMGSVAGSFIGGFAVVWLPELTTRIASQLPFGEAVGASVLSNAVYGLILVILTLVAPKGAITLFRALRRLLVIIEPAPIQADHSGSSSAPASVPQAASA